MSIKFNCSNSACQQRIAVDEAMAGKSVTCPACGTSLQVPASADIRFNCSNPDCGQHVVVSAGDAGRFTRCPACGKALRVPGAPPKPISSVPIPTVPEQGPQSPATSGGRKWSLIEILRAIPAGIREQIPILRNPVVGRTWQLIKGWSVGAVIFGAVVGGFYLRSLARMPQHMDAMLDEIYNVGEIREAPVANHAGNRVLYGRNVQKGIGIFLVDTATLSNTRIQSLNAADRAQERSFNLFGWSPDDSHLAFVALREGNQPRHVVICDGGTGGEKTSFDAPDSIEQGQWLSDNSLVLMGESHSLYVYNLEETGELGEYGKKGLVQIRKVNSHEIPYSLCCTSDHSVAYVDKGNIWKMDLRDGQAYQLTHLTGSVLEWLDYDPGKDQYLYCATAPRGKDRYVFKFDPGAPSNANTTRLTGNHSFKGQWLQGGSGFAYVGTKGNQNFLAVEATNPALSTTLFAEKKSSIRSYSMAPNRDKIFAVGATSYRLLTLWEYDISSRKLRELVPSEAHGTLFSELIVPVQAAVTNALGERVDYYYLSPPRMDPHKRYPVMMDQFSDGRYQQNFQFLANAGIFYVSVNRYGLASDSMPTRPEDALAVYKEFLKNPNVDPDRIYLDGRSRGTAAVRDMLVAHPELWHGVIVESPAVLPLLPDDMKDFPKSIFISVGDVDTVTTQEKCEVFMQDACQRLIRAKLTIGHGGHTFSSTDQLKDRYRAIAKFILTD